MIERKTNTTCHSKKDMRKVRLLLLKKLLVKSWFLRILASHAAASYMSMLVFLLARYFVSDEKLPEFDVFLLAPCYVPCLMVLAVLLFIQRLPFFDTMPPLSPYIALWMSYLVLLPSCIAAAIHWGARAEERISVLEPELGLPPMELDSVEKRLKRTLRISVCLILLALGTGWFAYRSRLFASAPDIELAYIPDGEFIMGSPPADDYLLSEDWEQPEHKVSISKGFYMGVTEITQAQWKAVMRYNPSEFRGGDLPVENVSWYGAVKFCKTLSEMTGKPYRLPTEAEWEYACRAGTQTLFHFGNDPCVLGEYAWYLHNSEGRTHPVGQKKPNAFGLYDMHGNVEEWCNDLFDEEYYKTSPSTDPENTSTGIFRVLRGGSWWYLAGSDESYCRCSARGATYPNMRTEHSGFRVVMDAE
jgi:formylglycine-generating enzyme required for sulfatase activity